MMLFVSHPVMGLAQAIPTNGKFIGGLHIESKKDPSLPKVHIFLKRIRTGCNFF